MLLSRTPNCVDKTVEQEGTLTRSSAGVRGVRDDDDDDAWRGRKRADRRGGGAAGRADARVIEGSRRAARRCEARGEGSERCPGRLRLGSKLGERES